LLSPLEYSRLPLSDDHLPSCVAWATVSPRTVNDGWGVITSECSLFLPDDESEEGIKAVVNKVRRHLDRFLDKTRDTPSDVDFYRGNIAFAPFFPVAQMYLSMPSGTDEPERVFSDCGLVLTDRRTRLSGDHLEKLLVVKRFLRTSPDNYFEELVRFLVAKLSSDA
jgi:hypothetical protein